MHQFIVYYHSRTLTSLSGRLNEQKLPLQMWKFQSPKVNLSATLIDSVIRDGEVNLHAGLNLFLCIEAESEDKAKSTTKIFCEEILNLISFTTSAFCESAKFINIIEFKTDGSNFLKQDIYPLEEKEISGGLVKIEESEFRNIFDAFYKNTEPNRIMRAISWLRKGLNEENIIDEFISYWVGVEVLKGVLKKKSVLLMKKPNESEWDGIKYVFEHKLKLQYFEKIKDARNKLLHGFHPLNDTFIGEINNFIQPTRRLLKTCILEILDLIDYNATSVFIEESRKNILKPWQVIGSELKGLPLEFSEIFKNYPSVKLKNLVKQYSVDNEGNLTISCNAGYEFEPKNIAWDIKFFELWGNKDSGIKNMKTINIS